MDDELPLPPPPPCAYSPPKNQSFPPPPDATVDIANNSSAAAAASSAARGPNWDGYERTGGATNSNYGSFRPESIAVRVCVYSTVMPD